MKIIGITGNIGSGKSTVDKYISRRYNLPLIDVDLLAKEVLEKNKDGLSNFGKDMVEDGKINFDAIFRNVFHDVAGIRKYNSWIHPLVANEVQARIQNFERKGANAVIISAALIFEARIKTDTLILIDCAEEIRKERIKIRSADEQVYKKALRLSELQFSSSIMRPYCNHVINNDGDFTSSTIPQIKKIMAEILKE